MREAHWPARPVARLLVVALGLLGIVVGPAGTGAHGGTSPTGTISGVRNGAAQQAPARTRSSTKHRPSPHEHAVVASPDVRSAPAVQPSLVVLPATVGEVRPPSRRAVRAVPARVPPDIAPRGVPRGRAPPSLPRI
ncbi:hypothetical protein BZB76_3343 [Actinomadura pelletieri DSM 43383]|uniref:Uncharacterized protein n=1 Tax=Actinomadura pelletieri DSM 43383 TaxID=1120940 RepID=A0A495QPF7_9ACTN|nr:hypothetical protein [Actinomadura pelletieri]RKS74821.1 hypothetical protein BZB76_3343 [Actinomadura pelletieri DSM 43383]